MSGMLARKSANAMAPASTSALRRASDESTERASDAKRNNNRFGAVVPASAGVMPQSPCPCSLPQVTWSPGPFSWPP